jgi:8-oxo-dGTP diphosphatase
VRESLSHPGLSGLGWERCAHLLENISLPVFALGGMQRGDGDAAQEAGAHGIAAIRAAWS